MRSAAKMWSDSAGRAELHPVVRPLLLAMVSVRVSLVNSDSDSIFELAIADARVKAVLNKMQSSKGGASVSARLG